MSSAECEALFWSSRRRFSGNKKTECACPTHLNTRTRLGKKPEGKIHAPDPRKHTVLPRM